jgi:hypothetical protein
MLGGHLKIVRHLFQTLFIGWRIFLGRRIGRCFGSQRNRIRVVMKSVRLCVQRVLSV